eukprot:CAMPEP_0174338840 /NCGR_PEP_ID=MMETSP0810-20121108/23474_1 /TAXON_ID=73025 ORGANISM="Eutreptiella gymnastica-like, Strain CCMP1594" /NCGR_SAMPLE_ID=MMETSP0810 /ASSEMBLY_ACC=CAM_ASM_000659 /LENGTH=109 /DNA_ID=CAMNT_0015459199 /DNA_START=1194 /DNA_END=1524 /DNA_ORIENTATION=+
MEGMAQEEQSGAATPDPQGKHHSVPLLAGPAGVLRAAHVSVDPLLLSSIPGQGKAGGTIHLMGQSPHTVDEQVEARLTIRIQDVYQGETEQGPCESSTAGHSMKNAVRE